MANNNPLAPIIDDLRSGRLLSAYNKLSNLAKDYKDEKEEFSKLLNTPSNNKLVLNLAVIANDLTIVAFLLQHGADPSVVDSSHRQESALSVTKDDPNKKQMHALLEAANNKLLTQVKKLPEIKKPLETNNYWFFNNETELKNVLAARDGLIMLSEPSAPK